jgi:transcriptional regulator with XRE-family HTH domain
MEAAKGGVNVASTNQKTFGTIIRNKREQLGVSRRALAEAAGVDASHILRLERGEKRPTTDLVMRLAKALKTNVEDLQAVATENLPRLAPYLRAKYDLDDEAVAELEEHFKTVAGRKAGKRGRS